MSTRGSTVTFIASVILIASIYNYKPDGGIRGCYAAQQCSGRNDRTHACCVVQDLSRRNTALLDEAYATQAMRNCDTHTKRIPVVHRS